MVRAFLIFYSLFLYETIRKSHKKYCLINSSNLVQSVFQIKLLKELYDQVGPKSGLVDSKLDSRLEGRGFKFHPLLDGNVVKAKPGWIPVPNPGSFNNQKERTLLKELYD